MSRCLLAGGMRLLRRLNSSAHEKLFDPISLPFVRPFPVGMPYLQEHAQIIVVARLVERGQASPGLNWLLRVRTPHDIAPAPKEVEAKAGEQAEQKILVAEGPHIFSGYMGGSCLA
jgi:hypothetical protein